MTERSRHAPGSMGTASQDHLEELRRRIAAVGADGRARDLAPEEKAARIPLGHEAADRALGGGLARGALHAVLPAAYGDEPAACGFASLAAARFAGDRPIVWIRQDMAVREFGEIHAPGLAGLGLDPSRLTLVAAADARDVLRAGEEALRCGALGAAIVEPWGDPKALDLTALRRLVLAAEGSGVAALLLRSGGRGGPDAAVTRWSVAAAPGRAEAGLGLGPPAFVATLERNRQIGGTGEPGSWSVEWNHERRRFEPATPSGARLPDAPDRPAEAEGAVVRLRA
jgi:protein ImuA